MGEQVGIKPLHISSGSVTESGECVSCQFVNTLVACRIWLVVTLFDNLIIVRMGWGGVFL